MRPFLGTFSLFLLFFGIGASCKAPFAASSPSEIYGLVAPSIVKVERLGGGSGSGFYVFERERRVLITNAHVCDGEKVMRIVPSDQSSPPYMATVERVSYEADLCSLSVTEGDNHSALKMARKEGRRGDAVFAVGHPRGADLSVAMGLLIGEQTISILYPASFCSPLYGALVAELFGPPQCERQLRSIQITAMTHPGNSGGPLVNAHGEVIGVDFASDELGGKALTLRALKAFLAE